MQCHLSGTTRNYLKESPMKLIIDEARLIGNERGLDFSRRWFSEEVMKILCFILNQVF
jgi:hypothetical protein